MSRPGLRVYKASAAIHKFRTASALHRHDPKGRDDRPQGALPIVGGEVLCYVLTGQQEKLKCQLEKCQSSPRNCGCVDQGDQIGVKGSVARSACRAALVNVVAKTASSVSSPPTIRVKLTR